MARKIIQVTNFDVVDIYKRIQQGEPIAKHSLLWGYDALIEAGYDVVVATAPSRLSLPMRCFRKVCEHMGLYRIEFALSALKAYWRNKDAVLIYTHYIQMTSALSFFRRIGLVKIPVIGITHDAFGFPSTDLRVWLRHDRVVCLCEGTSRLAEKKHTLDRNYRGYVDWGADLDFCHTFRPSALPARDYFLATGIENRDYEMLVEVFRQLPQYQLRIYSSKCNISNLPNLPSNVTVYTNVGNQSFSDMMPLFYNAVATIIPLKKDSAWCCGATVLFQSMALGTPVIISNGSANVFDIEQDGVGMNVEIGDADGMKKAVIRMMDDAGFREKCGRKGKLLAEKRYNYKNLCRQICKIIKDMELPD